MSEVELILLAVNYNLLVASSILCELHGYIFVLSVLTINAAETSVALSLIVASFLSDYHLSVIYQRVVKHHTPGIL